MPAAVALAHSRQNLTDKATITLFIALLAVALLTTDILPITTVSGLATASIAVDIATAITAVAAIVATAGTSRVVGERTVLARGHVGARAVARSLCSRDTRVVYPSTH